MDQPTKQEHTWFGSGVFLLGWNENLQPHGPLLDQFDTTALNPTLIKGAQCSFGEEIQTLKTDNINEVIKQILT